MNALLDTALQALGVKQLQPTKLDLKLLTDELGRTLPTSGVSAQYFGTAAPTWLGRGQDTANAGYANHGTAFSVVSYILDTAAPIPWGVYKLDGADNRATPQPKHPMAALLYRPNPKQTWAELKRQAQGGYEVNGEYFLRRVVPSAGSRNGKTSELWCLVGKVELLPLVGLGEFEQPTGYRHHDALTNVITDYPASEILHVKTWNPSNPHRGLSPVAAGSDAITAAKSGLESRVKQYQNQGPPVILADESEEQWTPEQAGGVQRFFDSFYPGKRREGRIPIISNSKLKAITLGLSAVDLDVLAAIPHDKDAICDLWHFPGQLLNGSKGTTFSNMGEAGAALYNRCVIPLETVFRDSLNRWLGPEYDDEAYIDFDISHIPELQPSKEKLATWLAAAWWIPVAERQRMMGVPVTWTGPEYLVPGGLVSLQEVTGVAPGDEVPRAGDEVN